LVQEHECLSWVEKLDADAEWKTLATEQDFSLGNHCHYSFSQVTLWIWDYCFGNLTRYKNCDEQLFYPCLQFLTLFFDNYYLLLNLIGEYAFLNDSERIEMKEQRLFTNTNKKQRQETCQYDLVEVDSTLVRFQSRTASKKRKTPC
jgi:hypothetical protein